MEKFDIIVIGGGHNGLIVGAYLQKLGFQVCVIERYYKVGGGVISEELTLPGFIHDSAAVNHRRIRNTPLIKNDELGLRSKYGLEYIIPEIPSVALFPDGSNFCIYKDLEKTVSSISRISKEDAVAYRKFNEWGEIFRKLIRKFANTQEPLKEIDIEFRSLFTKLAEYFQLRSSLFDFAPIPLYALLTGTYMDVVDYWFKHPKVRAFIAKGGSRAMMYPDDTATAIPGIIATLGSHTKSEGGGLARGGSGVLGDVLAKCFQDFGGTIITNAEVSEISIENGEAKGVVIKNGTKIYANNAIISSINIKQLFGQLIQDKGLPPNFYSAVQRLKHSSYSSITVHLALNDPPAYKGLKDISNVYRQDLLSTADEYLAGFNEIRKGLPPTNPCPTVVVPTILDPSRAPEGKHTLWIYDFVPYELHGLGAKGWDQKKEEVADNLIKRLQLYASNMGPENIIARHVDSPLDLERRNPSFISGDHEHLSHTLSQMTYNRPLPGWHRYRTPIKKLYMCGSSTHPSGGVTGGSRAAIQSIMKDLGIKGKLTNHLPKTS